MLYRNGNSILGFGCMRLPMDYAACEKLILRGMKEELIILTQRISTSGKKPYWEKYWPITAAEIG